MSQLRQPGDYLKHNRTGVPPPCVHTFTAESNQKVEKENLSNKTQFFPNSKREQFETTSKRAQN